MATGLTKRALDKLLAEELLGMKACNLWRPVYYKDQGPAIIKHCDHPDDTCYSVYEIDSLMGKLGGPPQYSSSSRAGLMLLTVLGKKAGRVLLMGSDSAGWSVRLYNGPQEGFRQLVDGPVAGTPEMAIALAGAALAGHKLTESDIVN